MYEGYHWDNIIMEAKNIPEENVLKFLDLVTSLKHTPRRGWTIRNVENHEQVSSHMYSMAMMTFLLDDTNNPQLDRLKCLQLALVHDFAEAVVGDITPYDNIPEEKKHRLEDDTMKDIKALLGDKIGTLIYQLYKEYEAKETEEAKFVKNLDIFDYLLTADYYERRDKAQGSLQEFFDCGMEKLTNPFVKKLALTLSDRRKREPPNEIPKHIVN